MSDVRRGQFEGREVEDEVERCCWSESHVEADRSVNLKNGLHSSLCEHHLQRRTRRTEQRTDGRTDRQTEGQAGRRGGNVSVEHSDAHSFRESTAANRKDMLAVAGAFSGAGSR